ncbi:TonB-dependent receptor [Granulicella tundricola]|uniref:TonB-dependent receptor n=1 Tax=Granulicella tundricola (strain ATCC BAA-1859 / DSM 23138 / MP5ACTX9) TaxID=1198114 RepID=E8X5B3_GRATM|nr:TonB-dependent receptor [Granulicella tundricola]ADW68377.1 TonB-dependent receptor [Granulicella tundricola MP5ACTX9]
MRLLPLALLSLAVPAHAVVVQGTVTGPFGQPVPGARIQLIQLGAGTRSVADAVSGVDGEYEIRTDVAGRFLLLTASPYFAPQIGVDFYAGRTDLVTRDITMDPSSLTPLKTTLPNNLDTPLAQLSTLLTQLPADHLLTPAQIPSQLPFAPATFLVQTGQQGQPAALYLRGANPDANAVLLDGQPIQSLGGAFNYGTFSTTGLAALASSAAVQLAPGPNPTEAPAAEAGTIAFATPRASTAHPALDYSGDAGNLHAWRNEAAVTLTRRRADLFAAYSHFNISNALSNDQFNTGTAALNAGYNIAANTSLRATLRQETSAAPLPIAYDLGLTPSTRDAAQNLYGTFTFDTRTAGGWHNQLRYGLVRRREQLFVYTEPAPRLVTLRGANGSTITGLATYPNLPARADQATNRDQATYQTDYPLTQWLTGLFTFRYQNERALDAQAGLAPSQQQGTPAPSFSSSFNLTNLTFATAFKAEYKHRLFGEASGDLNHSNFIGFTGSPRLGLTYTPVYLGARRFRGTSLHATVAASSREPGLPEIVSKVTIPARSRTLDLAVDQNILGRKLILHAAYFHNQFSHQTEQLAPNALALSGTQAFRTQGFTTELRYQPLARLFIRGGYTYMASLIEQSAATTSLYTPVVGSRPFRRPANTGYFTIQYTGRALSAGLAASLAGRSDDSTFTPTLALPTHNLDFGYTRLDANLSYSVFHNLMLFTDLTNLLNDQHIGPIGYPGPPLTIRAGLKLRLGGD